jgi:serine/threonine-protein kinase SRPK3
MQNKIEIDDLLRESSNQFNPEPELDKNTVYPDLDKVGILAKDYEDQAIYSEDEGIEDYKEGGYHSVHIGEILHGRYVILQKLGWGHFSTVWLSRDTKYNTYVAIKVQKSASHYLEAAFDEVEILQKAVTHSEDKEWLEELKKFYHGRRLMFDRNDCHVVQLLNAFIYSGPFGKHFCMVFEILGVNLLEIIKRYDYKGIPLPICRKMARQILLGLRYLHKYCGIIHTDLKPENVMICLEEKELKEIYDKGQIKKEDDFKNLKEIRKNIKILNNEELTDDSDLNAQVNEEEEQHKDHEEDGEDHEVNTKVMENPEIQKLLPELLLTKEDLEKEYENEIKLNNITNTKEQKALRKKLKNRLKKHKKRLKRVKVKILKEEKEKPKNEVVKKLEQVIDVKLLKKGGLKQNFNIKIADLGNGCWTHHHFQPEIQTRQYRSPEVILGINYNETADMWSFACMLFEMLTGEFLFDPKKDENFRKSEDHLALMMELLNKFPKNYATIGTNSKKYLNEEGNLNKIKNLNFMNLKDLMMKYHGIKESEAQALSDFLMPILEIYPQKRATAEQMLNHYWLDMDTTEFFASEEEKKKNPHFYDKSISDKRTFEKSMNESDFFADSSDVEAEEDDPEEFYEDFYDKQIKKFDRSFKKVYVGYADGIDLNALDNMSNWQFTTKTNS